MPLEQLCDTRCACRLECLKVILIRYSQVIIDLEEIDVADAFIMLKVVQTLSNQKTIENNDVFKRKNTVFFNTCLTEYILFFIFI